MKDKLRKQEETAFPLNTTLFTSPLDLSGIPYRLGYQSESLERSQITKLAVFLYSVFSFYYFRSTSQILGL